MLIPFFFFFARDIMLTINTSINLTPWHCIITFKMEQVLGAAPDKAAAVRPPTTPHENYPS